MIFTDDETRNNYFDCLIDSYKQETILGYELCENMIINLSKQEQSKLMMFLLSQSANLNDENLNRFVLDVIFNRK